MKNIKKLIFLSLILLASTKAVSEEYKLKQINLDSNYKLDKQIIDNYGNLWIAYKENDESFVKNGKNKQGIQTVELYYKKSSDYIFLGKLNVDGIYDSNNNLLCRNIIFYERFNDLKPLGYMEEILQDPFYTGQYYLRNGLSYGALEPYAFLSIDFEKNTIIVTHVSD